VEASRRCAARKHDLLAFADDMSSAGDDVRSSSLHLVATLNQCATLAASLPATPTADDLLRVTALKSDASRHWRAATTAAQAVRGAADRFRARLADPSDSRSTSVQDQAVRDLKAADERIATLNQQLVADKSSADAAAKREAALKQESARLDALSKQLTAQLDAANARVTTLEQQLATAKSNAATAAAAAAAAAAKPAPSATPAAAAAAVAPAATTVVSLQNASSEQLAQYASDVSLKAKSDVLKEALRSASKAADELVSATLDISSDVSAFVTAAKTSAAALTRPLQLAAQILSSAAQLPIYTYEGGAEDAELLVRYKRAIFDLISEAKRIRSGDEGAAVAQLDAQQLEHRRNTVKMQLFFFGKTIEQVIYSGIWL
jgi:hypothetical protein